MGGTTGHDNYASPYAKGCLPFYIFLNKQWRDKNVKKKCMVTVAVGEGVPHP